MECREYVELVGNSSLAHMDVATRDVVLGVVDHKGVKHKGHILCKIRSGKRRDGTCVKKPTLGIDLDIMLFPSMPSRSAPAMIFCRGHSGSNQRHFVCHPPCMDPTLH